ncbi:MAG: M15 family metallopeptidase [Firmicutes bacterium]|nr:M15 family metallopeptidase [Bacillota bacterium]
MNTSPTHRPGPADLKRRRTIFYIAASAFIVVALVLIVVLVIEIRARVRDEVKTRLQNSSQTQQEGSTDGTLAQNGETSGDASANASGETYAEGSEQNSGENSGERSGESSAEGSSESSGESSGETSAARLFATKTEQMSEDEIHKGILQLVNKQHEYLFLDDWLIYMADIETRWGYALNDYEIQMAEPAAYAMDAFLNDFCEETGSWDLYMMNGFRSAEEADWLFNRSAEQNGYEHAVMYVMRAGYSEHHTGLASDFGLFSGVYFDAENDDRNNWIYEHAADYGFVLRYPEDKVDVTEIGYESWHFRYVSVPVAVSMVQLDYCLEEWLAFIQDYSVDSPYQINAYGTNYAIYYTKGTTVEIPTDMDYTISGDNMEGFIVIVTLP